MKNKGFTLIELLATLVILSIIMLIAIPSTLSILEKNRQEVMVSDSKRLVALAESEIKNNDEVDMLANEVMIFNFADLDDGTFEKDADGFAYDADNSYVAVFRNTDFNADDTVSTYKYEYYIQLIGGKRGILLTNSRGVKKDIVKTEITTLPVKNTQIIETVNTDTGKTIDDTSIKTFSR